MAKLLVVERGLNNTPRNRKWLALMQYLDKEGLTSSQESAEFQAWKIIKLLEDTK